MDGRAVFQFAVTKVTQLFKDVFASVFTQYPISINYSSAYTVQTPSKRLIYLEDERVINQSDTEGSTIIDTKNTPTIGASYPTNGNKTMNRGFTIPSKNLAVEY